MALSKTTQDHDEIRQWAEARGGKPADVASTEKPGAPGILRIEFPGATNANDANLNEISWEEFFEKFDASGLSLVYQEVTSEGAESNFNRLVYPENLSTSARKSTGTKAASAKGSAKKAVPAKASGKKAAPSKAPAKTTAKKTAAPKKTAAKTAATKLVKPAAKSTPAKTSQITSKKTSGTKAGGRKTAATAKTAARKTSAKTTKAGAQRAAVAIKKKIVTKKTGAAKKENR